MSISLPTLPHPGHRHRFFAGLLLMASLAVPCSAAAEFKATGNTDPDHKAAPNKQGEGVVTFDSMPVRMSFDLPGHIKMITENGIPYTNGATETYIEGFAEGQSYESWNDEDNEYSRMWIESQNDARVVVRHRCALVNKGRIAHQDDKQVAPYGPGNWTDEWYVIHPDGTHTRRITIYTSKVDQSTTHARGQGFFYELEGMYLWWGHVPGKMASDHLEDGVLTLIEMDGRHQTIDFTPYPMDPKTGKGMAKAYGDFRHANIHVVNTRSEFHPWRAGRPAEDGGAFWGKSLLMTPYRPVHELVQLVPCFPPGTTRESGYSVAGLGQMIYSDYWQQTDTSFSEIWLNGFTSSKDPAGELAALARSWWNAPKASASSRSSAKVHGYDVAQRAYLVELPEGKGPQPIDLRIPASASQPLINPAFLIGNWGNGDAVIQLDGKAIPQGSDCRIGHYESLTLDAHRTWHDVLVVWLKTNTTDTARLSILPEGSSGAIDPAVPVEDAPFRTWTSTKGTTVEARLVEIGRSSIVLEKRDGTRIPIRIELLSPADREHLADLDN
jgi:hypothetical protein